MLDNLTVSERRVATLVARGWTNREVADQLSLRPKTVEWTLTNVYRKLKVSNRTEASHLAHRDGLLDRDAMDTETTPIAEERAA